MTNKQIRAVTAFEDLLAYFEQTLKEDELKRLDAIEFRIRTLLSKRRNAFTYSFKGNEEDKLSAFPESEQVFIWIRRILNSQEVLAAEGMGFGEALFFVWLIRVEAYIYLTQGGSPRLDTNTLSFYERSVWNVQAIYHFRELVKQSKYWKIMPSVRYLRIVMFVAEACASLRIHDYRKACASLRIHDYRKACVTFLDDPENFSHLDVFTKDLDGGVKLQELL